METPIITIKGLSKCYRLGQVGRTTLREDFSRFWRRLRNSNDQNEAHAGVESKEYLWALKEIDLSINSGEVVGILGKNGAGKSTLLKVLSRITEPTEGIAQINGRLASLLEVGTGFHPELTGRENVFLNGAILGLSKGEIRERFNEIIEFSEIGAFIDTPVKRYSSGMYVRLAFSIAAHLHPDILFVDEVLAVGDLGFRNKCIEKMKSMTRSGMTILFVSHDMYLLQTLCDKGIFIKDGQMDYFGDIHTAVARYKSSLTHVNDKMAAHGIRESEDVALLNWKFNNSEERVLTVNGVIDLTVEWELDVKKPITAFWGVSFTSSDGIYISGLSSHLEGIPFELVKGKNRGVAKFPELDLPSGNYRVNISVMNDHGIPVYLHMHSAGVLSVERKLKYDGVVGLKHTWSHHTN